MRESMDMTRYAYRVEHAPGWRRPAPPEPREHPLQRRTAAAAIGIVPATARPADHSDNDAAASLLILDWSSAELLVVGLLVLMLLITASALGLLLLLRRRQRADRSALLHLQRQRPLLHARIQRARRQLETQREERERATEERRQWRQSLRRARSRLDRQDLLLASLGHEIRSPLRSVLAVVDLVDRDIDPALRPQLRIISDLTRHVLRVADDSLELATIERGAAPLAATRFALEIELERALRAIGARSSRRVHLAVDFEPGMPMGWIGDAARIRQILINLLSNALDHTEHGAVTVSFARAHRSDDRPGPGLTLTVRDSGTGIAPGEQSRIFEPFVQGAASGGLAGLGLSVVARITELMNGEIRVDSELGVGSTFTVTLPLPAAKDGFPVPSRGSESGAEETAGETAGKQRDTQTQTADRDAPPLRELRCGLCVDHPIERHALAGYLSHWGARVEVFPDPGAISARLATGAQLDAVIIALDTVPARLSLLAALRRDHPGLRVIESRGEAAAESFWPSALAAALSTTPSNPAATPFATARRAGAPAPTGSSAAPLAIHSAIPSAAPSAQTGDRSTTTTRETVATPSTQGARVLIVDDHPVARRVLLDVLSGLGCRVIAADGGSSALEIAEDPEEQFDWVLLDRQMPGLDGLTTAAALRGRSATRSAQLVLLVNEQGGDHPEQGLVDVVLQRPAGIEALRDALRTLLSAKATRSPAAAIADADLQQLRDETLGEDLEGLLGALDEDDADTAEAHLHRMQGALRICPDPGRSASLLDLQQQLATADRAAIRASARRFGELLAGGFRNPV